MEKSVQIELATNKTSAYENFADIREAVYSQSLGLYSKYNVQIINVVSNNEKVIMNIRIPDDIVHNFNIGNHMRGVSAYLIRNKNEKYAQYLVGNRLLKYIEIPTPNENEENISFSNKLSAIGEFIELLKHDDETSREKISKIIEILYNN
jgi:hypothetical protein